MTKAEEILRKHLKAEWMLGGDSEKAIISAMEEYAKIFADSGTGMVAIKKKDSTCTKHGVTFDYINGNKSCPLCD